MDNWRRMPAPKDGNLSTPVSSPPSPHTTDHNDNQSDLSHDNKLGPDDSNTDDDNDDYDASLMYLKVSIQPNLNMCNPS